MNIARWTTPSITYKPSAVSASEIDEIRLVITQGGVDLIIKTQDDATLSDGTFYWEFTQEETSMLTVKQSASIQVDYLTNTGKRFTTQRYVTNISNSAVDEVIS